VRNCFYAIYYTGVAGSGFGIVSLFDGIILGVDAAGGKYDGKYFINDETSELEGDLHLEVPAGAHLVTGIPAQKESLTLNIPLKLSKDLGKEQPMLIETSSGPVNVIFKLLREFPDKK